MTTDVMQRVQSLSTKYKILIALGACLIVAPLTALILWGFVGVLALIAAGIVGCVAIAFAPVFAMKLANWQLRAVIAEAEANPIPTRWNNFYIEERNLQSFAAQIESFAGKIIKAKREQDLLELDYPNDPDTAYFRTYVADMERLKDLQWADFKDAQVALEAKRRAITKMERMFNMANTAQAAGAASGARLTHLQEIAEKAAIGAADQRVADSLAQLQRRLNERVSQPGTPVTALADKRGREVIDVTPVGSDVTRKTLA